MSIKETEFTTYHDFLSDSEWMIGIDPGHGGMIGKNYQTFPDKMYDHGDFMFYEGVFNRQVTLFLTELLLKANLSHYLTTTSNYDVGLSIRVTRANNYLKLHPEKKQLFLSIHSNAAPKGQESATGIEVWTSKKDTPADPSATIFFNELKKMGWEMRMDKKDGDPDKEANFFVLYHTITQAVLVELGFFSNRKEAELLLKPKTQKAFATHLFNAILKITNHGKNVQN